MLKNYFRTAFRNLVKDKFYSAINMLGLAAGLATCLLILLYVKDERSFDKYNLKADRIYRVNNEVRFGDNHYDLAQAPALMGITMAKELPQVEQYTRLSWGGSFSVKKGNENIREGRVGYGDSTLFKVFTLPLLAGDAATALVEPHSMVITEKIARKYFNSIQVAGKTMLINDTASYKITAVIKDIPVQSHFNFDFFLPFSESADSRNDNWLSENYNTYVLVRDHADLKQLGEQTDAMLEKYTAPLLQNVIGMNMQDFKKSGGYVRSSLTPLTDIHLHSNKVGELDGNGNAQVVYIFSGIAILILLIACVNFMNLSTARSANRAKEVGVRKVLGSLKKNLVQQFLAESLLISMLSMLLAVGLASLLLPYFNQLAAKTIAYSTLFSPSILLMLLPTIIIVGLLAGAYPAFFLSSFQPIAVLKGKLSGGFKRSWLRSSLVVFQFIISIVLIFGTVIIYRQLSYIQHKDVGFDRSQVLVINHTDVLAQQAITFRNELLQLSGVQNASLSGFLPVNYNRDNDVFFTSPALDQSSAMGMQRWRVDDRYIPTLGMQMEQGRNFSADLATDSSAIIINEAAAKFLHVKDLLNKNLYSIDDPKTKNLIIYHIIGVVKSFNFSSLREVVTPLSFVLQKSNRNLSVRLKTTDMNAAVAGIKNKWQAMAGTEVFDYSFMDEDFNKLYTAEQKTAQIFISFAVLAVLIACLGLFGLITFAAAQRTKEIGIRKVLGANTGGIVGMLSLDFLKLVLISALIALPLGWWAMHNWLQDFAYRVNISWWIFLVVLVITILIAFATICFQAIKAARANPVNSLRND